MIIYSHKFKTHVCAYSFRYNMQVGYVVCCPTDEVQFASYHSLLLNVAALNDSREEAFKMKRFQPHTIKYMESPHHMDYDQYEVEDEFDPQEEDN